MSRFYVGQRVRIVSVAWSCNRHMIGMEAVITGFEEDGVLLDIRHLAKIGVAINPGCLEPILYDGNTLVQWSECLWQPEGQTA